jgi:SHS2 domain-containing protein
MLAAQDDTPMWEIDHHTADLRIRVTADSLRDLFADAVRALTEVMEPEGSSSRRDAAFAVRLEAADATLLLVDFLNAALTASHIHRFAFTDVDFQSFEPTRLSATLLGLRVRGFAEDVKSVTYHGAQVACVGQAWKVTLVLDI